MTTPAPHTPGPWKIRPDGKHGILILDSIDFGVARTWHEPFMSGRPYEANARLIAAAPALLAALKDLVRLAPRDDCRMDNGWINARAAISLAEKGTT